MADSYHSRGMGYFRLYELNPLICLFSFTHIQTRRGLDMDIENTVFIGIYIATVCEDGAVSIRIKNYI